MWFLVIKPIISNKPSHGTKALQPRFFRFVCIFLMEGDCPVSNLSVKQKKKKGKGSTGSSFDNLEIFLLHLPTTIWYLLFCYAPMFGVIIAFKNYKPRPDKSFLWALFNNKIGRAHV